VTTERKEFIIRTLAEFKDINEIKNVIIIPDKYGRNIYLKDIAEVKDASDIQRIITKLNGREGVKLSIFKQSAANTIDVEKGVQQKLKELKSMLPTGIKIEIIYNQADYIKAANKGVRNAAMLAGIFVVLITILFLTGWRRVLIIVLTLLTTLLATFLVMKLLNFSINIFSLGGLVVSFTVILDNSIVVLQNITRLQEEKRRDAISFGANQVGKPILFSTLTFMAIFLPFLMVPGLTSLLFGELVITVAIVIAFSLISAITVVPALATLLFGSKGNESTKPALNRFQIIVDKTMLGITKKYAKLLKNILERKKGLVIILAFVFLLLSIFIFRFIGTEFLPKADDGMITAKVKMPTGTAVSVTGQVLSQIENAIKDLPYIESYSTLVGGKVSGLVTYEIPNEGEVDIQLVPKSKRKLSTDQWVNRYAEPMQKNIKYPGAKVKVFHTKMKGIRQVGEYDIEVELHSPRTTPLIEMFNTATKMMSLVKEMEELGNLDLSIDLTKPEYQILVNREKIADLGIPPTQIANSIKTLVDGQIVTYYKEEGYYYPIRLVVNEENFRGKQDVANIPLFHKNGLIYLRDIARVIHGVGPVEIDRLDQMRIIKVTASVLRGDIGKVSQKVYQKIKDVELPSGSFIKLGAQAQMMSENFRNVLFVVLLGLFFAFVVLTLQFESLVLPTLILFTIPFPIAGFLFALFIAKIPIGVTALIGIIVLVGMLINHWVLVLSFIEEKLADGIKLKEAIITGASLRLEPIFMTFLTDVSGLFPFVLAVQEGTEMLRPLGIAVVGGITYSLFITFFFLPTLYYVTKNRLIVRGQ
jgi:multidrug efflux pump subunit AcrB